MKKTKVIIPALGILLLSTAASVTGTVAWYAANNSVTATGMNIKAEVDSNFLAINNTNDLTGHKNTVALGTTDGAVLPTNRAQVNSSWTWVSGIGTDADDGTLVGNYTALTGIAENTTTHFGTLESKNYFVFDSVYVGLVSDSTSASDYNLKANVKFTAAKSSELNKCLTVGIEVGEALVDDFNERFVLDSASTEGATDADPDYVQRNGASVLIAGEDLPHDGTHGAQIRIYAFFNGDHEACTSGNAINLDDITIDLEFVLVKKA